MNSAFSFGAALTGACVLLVSARTMPSAAMTPSTAKLPSTATTPSTGMVQAPDLEKGIKAKEPEVRLATVQLIARDTDPRSEHLLVTAARDADWEVALRAIEALSVRGTKPSLEPMVKLALEAPLMRLRDAAAHAVAHIAPDDGATALLRRTQGDDARVALEALAVVLAGRDANHDLGSIAKLAEKAKDPGVRAAAARVVAAAGWKERDKALGKILDGPYVRSTCAALEALAANPRAGDLERALDLLAKPVLDDCVARRATRVAESALRATPGGIDVARVTAALKPLVGAKDGGVAARGVRIVERMATPPPAPESNAATAPPVPPIGAPIVAPDAALAALAPALAHPDERARAAAAHALAQCGPGALDTARGLVKGDKSARVRRAALLSLLALHTVAEEPERGIALQVLANDADPEVRRTAAVQLGRKGMDGAVGGLLAATADKDWSVGVCAAVSLGKTQAGSAVEPLAQLARTHADWKLRAAAVTGLGRMYLKSAVPPAIDALNDADPMVVRCAYSFLCDAARETSQDPPVQKREPWLEWWTQNKERLVLVDPATQAEFKKRFRDSGTSAPEIFRDMDVIVLESEGDHIETVLEGQKIAHRMTMSGKVAGSGLSADALFVANCTGKIEDQDVERLRWFVYAGGYLFGSCWALHETIERVVPGVVARHETRDEVVANVEARDCSRGSPYLEGVFAPGVQPLYALEGAYLIDVVDPERAEVLIDSPECAEGFGCGNLAAWFQAGHGVVLDSVNHYEAQGLENAIGLKKPEDRQAYAVDHMGLALDKLRAVKNEAWWESANKASKQVSDLSVFHLVSNFVRQRRMAQ